MAKITCESWNSKSKTMSGTDAIKLINQNFINKLTIHTCISATRFTSENAAKDLL